MLSASEYPTTTNLRPTYMLAMLTGLRANELRSLPRTHLDTVNNGLRLESAWTKNREPGFQPLPAKLVHQLQAFAASGIVPGLYQQFARTLTIPQDPLVFVNTHPARELDRHLQAAGIPKTTPEGKLAFHALRTSFVTFTYEVGATHKEAQELARHATPGLTANTYARTRNERLAGITERIAEKVLGGGTGAPVVHQAGAAATPETHKYLLKQAPRATETDWRRRVSNTPGWRCQERGFRKRPAQNPTHTMRYNPPRTPTWHSSRPDGRGCPST